MTVKKFEIEIDLHMKTQMKMEIEHAKTDNPYDFNASAAISNGLTILGLDEWDFNLEEGEVPCNCEECKEGLRDWDIYEDYNHEEDEEKVDFFWC